MDREVVYGDRPGSLCTALGRCRVWSRLCSIVTQCSGCWPWDTVPVIAALHLGINSGFTGGGCPASQ